MKGINTSWNDGRDVYYPTDEPNLAHVETLGHGNACPDFFNLKV